MTDKDPELTRVAVYLPSQHVPELMAYLGVFAVDRDFTFNTEQSLAGASEPGVAIESRSFDPSLVSFLPEGENGNVVPVVTGDHIERFALKTGLSRGFGTRIVSGLNAESKGNTDLQAMLYGKAYPEGRFWVVGIRAEHVHKLVYRLGSTTPQPRKIGRKSINLLAEYAKQLSKEHHPAS